MSSVIRVVDLTSSLGRRSLAKIGLAHAPGEPCINVPLAASICAAGIEWGGAPTAMDPLSGPCRPQALILLAGPGSMRQAQGTLQQALDGDLEYIRIFLMPSAIMEEIALKQMLPAGNTSIVLYRLPDSSAETLWFVLLEELNKLSSLVAPMASPHTLPREDSMSQNLSQSMQTIISIDGAIAAALVDYQSGMCLAKLGDGLDLDLAAAGNTEVVKAKLKTMESLGMRKGIEDILITLGNQYHLIRLIPSHPGLFLYLVLDKVRGNLALARYKLTDVERALKV